MIPDVTGENISPGTAGCRTRDGLNSLNSRPQHIFIYDYIRLFGILLVVFGHSAFTDMGGMHIDLANVSSLYFSPFFTDWRRGIAWIYSFHMPLFFILSGAVYGITWVKHPEPERLLPFLHKKTERLLLPCLLYGLLYMVPVKYFCGYYHGSYSKAVELFLQGHDNGAFWFLMTLFWCFLLAYIIRILNWFIFRGSIITFLIAGIALNFLIALPFGSGKFDWYHIDQLTRHAHFLCFLFGIAFEHYREKWDHLLDHCWILPVSIGLASLIILKYFPGCALFNALSGWFLFYLISRLLMQQPQPWHTLRFFPLTARNLFGVYLWHDPLNYVIVYFAARFHWLQCSAGVLGMYFLRFVGIFILSLALNETCRSLIALLHSKRSDKDSAGKKTFPVKSTLCLLAAALVMSASVYGISVYSQNNFRKNFAVHRSNNIRYCIETPAAPYLRGICT